MNKAILIMMLLSIISCNNASNAQTQNNNAVNNQNNSSNAMYNEELKKSPINIQTNADGRIKSRGFAAVSANMDFKFTRHAVGSNDVLIEILYAGICHSDIHMLKRGGTMCILGLPRTSKMPTLIAMVAQHGSKKLFGSLIGGIKETQEMLNYSIENNIYPAVEIIKADAQTISDAYRKVIDGKVKFRYVIDMRTIE